MANSKLSLKRLSLARAKGQKLQDPHVFLSPKRLDLAAKIAFARAYVENNTSEWPEIVYREHIRAFNGFFEDEPRKETYEDFKNSFLEILKSVELDDDWKHHAPVLASGDYLFNGAHRTAASIVLKDKINTAHVDIPAEQNWGSDFFRLDKDGIAGIDEDVLDYMTVEYVTQKQKDIHVAIIFPTAEGHRDEAYKYFATLGDIINMKTFAHDEFVPKEVIKQLYSDPEKDRWNDGLDFKGAQDKADQCFANGHNLQVYVIEASLDEATRQQEKEYLRGLWKKDKHSIHITDTIEEANRVVRMFFNENSRRFMKVDRRQEFASQKMRDMFNEYMKLAPKDILEREKVAIEGSAVLDLLNIRAANDVDYISRDPRIDFRSETIEKHTELDSKYHTVSIDEVTTNPKYYFYYKGIKFVDIVEMQKYKQAKGADGNEKDVIDTRRIERFFNRNPQYGIVAKKIKAVEQPLFSIVVPLFNKRDFLAACLESIQHQTEKNWECIIVNDGSTDGGEDVAMQFVEHDGRFRLINQKNAGPSSARNRGIEQATGKLIHFLDADDFYPSRTTLKAIGNIYRRRQPKAIAGTIGAIHHHRTDVDYDLSVNASKKKYQTFDELQNDYFFTRFFFDREFIVEQGVVFPEYTYTGEDPVFLVKALSSMDNYYITDIPVYVYNTVASSNSTLKGQSEKNIIGYINAQIEVMEICRERGYRRLMATVLERLDAEMLAIFARYASTDEAIREKMQILQDLIDVDAYRDVISKTQFAQSEVARLHRQLEQQEARTQQLRKEVERLAMPSMKLASRKLAGAVRRRVKREIAKVTE